MHIDLDSNPWDHREVPVANLADIDALELRSALQRMSISATVDQALDPDFRLNPLVPSLCLREPRTGVIRPRNFTMLLFGQNPQKTIFGASCLFSVYPGPDRSFATGAKRYELAGTLLGQWRRLQELLSLQSYTVFDKTDTVHPNLLKYPSRALQEAVSNALAHRNYEMDEPIRVTCFLDRIEIVSPGSLPIGVDPVRFRAGQAGARWRNQGLAWILNRLEVAQAEGQGITAILQAMRAGGCPDPELELGPDSLTCTLSAQRRVVEIESGLPIASRPERS